MAAAHNNTAPLACCAMSFLPGWKPIIPILHKPADSHHLSKVIGGRSEQPRQGAHGGGDPPLWHRTGNPPRSPPPPPRPRGGRHRSPVTHPKPTAQFCTAMTRFCGPFAPPSVNVSGTESLAATLGTTTLNW